jgi:hypothetical protein
MKHYRKKIEEIVMMMDMRTAKIVILSIMTEIAYALNTAVRTKLDSA